MDAGRRRPKVKGENMATTESAKNEPPAAKAEGVSDALFSAGAFWFSES